MQSNYMTFLEKINPEALKKAKARSHNFLEIANLLIFSSYYKVFLEVPRRDRIKRGKTQICRKFNLFVVGDGECLCF